MRCEVPGCMENDHGERYSGRPLCMEPFSGSPEAARDHLARCMYNRQNHATVKSLISPTMADALQQASNHNGELVRVPGGYWTWRGCPTEYAPGVGHIPTWRVGTRTILRMVDMNLAEVTEKMKHGDANAIRLTKQPS